MITKSKYARVGISVLALCIVVALLVAVYFDKLQSAPAEVEINEISDILTAQANQVFDPVLPDSPVRLPSDFAFHNEFQHEWWHFFANVTDENGEEYGVQWSYFRIASNDSNMSGWLSPQIFVSHVVISSKDKVWREQRIARGGIGQAGMTNQPFRVWIDNWYWRSLGRTPFPGQLVAATDTFALELKTATRGPYVIPGERGYQQKHDLLPVASYNITAPFLRVKGTLHLGDDKHVSVTGDAWMSKEWGSGLMAEGQKGWDWFVLRLDDDKTLSVSRYRHSQQLPYMFATLSTNDGKVYEIKSDEIVMEPIQPEAMQNGKQVPTRWFIHIPKYNINLSTRVTNADLWLPFVIPYWEGPIKATGSHSAKGFMQLTGY